jgi:uncharacterized protein YjbI with pentapeptide repeats
MSNENNIYKHIENDFNRKNQLSSCYDVCMDKDLKNILFYNASFRKCKWFGCDLTNSSANGNIFSENDFRNCHIDNASMEYCSFSEETFHKCSFQGSSFAHSTFHYSILEDCEILGSSFMETLFSHMILRNNKISSSNFELCRFQDTHLENMNLTSLNFRYSFFERIVMHKVTLPFLQIPYTFNGLQYVFRTDDEINFESREKGEAGTISYKQYTNMLPDFIDFFKKQQEYFPLANCYDVQGDNKRAQESNEAGIKQSVANRDFRYLYYYCIQAAYVLKCKRETRTDIYKKINRDLQSISLKPAEYYQFGFYFPMIKKLLIDNPGDNPTLSVSMKTNIESSDYEGLGYFLHLLETLQGTVAQNLDGQHIEVRRNSPAVINWLSSGGAETLFNLLKTTYSILQPVLYDAAALVAILGFAKDFMSKPLPQTPKKGKQKVSKETSNLEERINNEEKYECEEKNTTTILREEIQQLLQSNIDIATAQSIEPITEKSSNISKEQLTQWIDKLQHHGIKILDFDVQILDGEKNILDNLYKNFFNQYYNHENT